MFGAVTVLLLFVSCHSIFADHDVDFCRPVTDPTYCDWTFGCYWKIDPQGVEQPACTEQEYWAEDEGDCEDALVDLNILVFPDEHGYDCWADGTYYYVYEGQYYDSCSYDYYTLETCPTQSADEIPCTWIPGVGCYEIDCELAENVNDPFCSGCSSAYDPGCACDLMPWDDGCYYNKTNAGICEGRGVFGCGAIPFCKWNSSKCQPDWKCYYSNISGVACDQTNGCKSELIGGTRYCTSDTITSSDETCILAGADQSTCEAAKCEWVAPGSTTTAGSYTGWCTQVGSGAFVARLSSAAVMVLLSVMLIFL